MSSNDPGLVGLFNPPSKDDRPAEPIPQAVDAVLSTAADAFANEVENGKSSQTEHLSHRQLDKKETTSSSQVLLPPGSVGAADGSPFTDYDSAKYKADTLSEQLGQEFLVQALSATHFVVRSTLSSTVPESEESTPSENQSDYERIAGIPIKQLTLDDFPPGHPVHKCGLGRFKKYMKKDFRFKPAYRSMLNLIPMIPLGLLVYLKPVFFLNLLPPDILQNIVDSVPSDRLVQGTSLIGAALAAFASVKILWQRHFDRYVLAPGYAKHEAGIVSRESTKIAYKNVVNYDVKQGVIGRLLNFGSIELSSAGSDGAEIEMHSVLAPRLVELVLEYRIEEAKPR